MTVAVASQSFSTRWIAVSETGSASAAGTSTVCRASDLGGTHSGRARVMMTPITSRAVALISVFGLNPSASPAMLMCTGTGSGIASQRSRMYAKAAA